MKIDLIKLIYYFLTSLCSSSAVYIIGYKIGNKKIDIKDTKSIMYLIIISILFVLNYFLFQNPFRIINSYLIISFYYKVSLNEKIKKALVLGFIMIILLTFSEIVFSIFITIFSSINKNIDGDIFLLNSIANITIGLLSLIIYNFSKKFIKSIIEKYTNKIRVNLIITSILIILVFGILFMSFINNNWKINSIFYFDVAIILSLIMISALLLFQEYSKINLQEKYEMANKYMQTNANLMEKYSSIQHQYKNQLIIIKGYVNKKNTKLVSYINELLKDYKNKKYEWITKINNINIDGLRYLIFYKLIEAENSHLKLDVQINEKIREIDFKFLTIKEINVLSTIIGEYLDNAIYASKESKEKELCFDCYLDDGVLIFEISNSYSNRIDMKSISKRGYSTKGMNRGLGLFEVDKIIKASKRFTTSRVIKKSYFIAKVFVDLKNSR